jgi:tRNA (adenine37-N6)-methyltransferase
MFFNMRFTMTAVGFVRAGRPAADDDFWGGTICQIELADSYGPDSLAGLQDFSHLEIVFVFDRVAEDAVETTARHPRNRADWPLVGIFGQRGKRRPNRIGVSRCALLEVRGRVLVVEGLDAIDGTPVLDIKPWMKEFGPLGDTRQPSWANELMADYYRPEIERT